MEQSSLSEAQRNFSRLDLQAIDDLLNGIGKDKVAAEAFISDPTGYVKSRMSALSEKFHCHIELDGIIFPPEELILTRQLTYSRTLQFDRAVFEDLEVSLSRIRKSSATTIQDKCDDIGCGECLIAKIVVSASD